MAIQSTVATFMRNGGQNDLNQNGHCHQNIYITSNGGSPCNGTATATSNGVLKINNAVAGTASRAPSTATSTVVKKLETTEL